MFLKLEAGAFSTDRRLNDIGWGFERRWEEEDWPNSETTR
jgi:hypothetical protein